VNRKAVFDGSWLRSSGLALACGAVTVALVACGNSKTDATATAPGGVRKACAARASWATPISQHCSNCKAKATTPKCTSCNVKPYSGACADQEKARRDEPSCNDIEVCLFRCKGDCDCLDKCYEGKAACEKLAGAVDACVNEACAESCK
jgi:hypothetical protein